MSAEFPRTQELPRQSPLFWVTHKDRYLRQLLIRDIEAQTQRALIVYFTDCDHTEAQIDQSDDTYLSELLTSCVSRPVDLMLETNGGSTDATEKICAVLRASCSDLRVVVPRRAKSNGTVVALTGASIVMGIESELGPIDPSIGAVPVHFVLNAPAGTFNPIELQLAQTARLQTVKLAKHLLMTGMLSTWKEEDVGALVDKIATRDHYHSHGSVIDAAEVQSLGLRVDIMPQDNPLWRRFWLLRTMYQYDSGVAGYSKLFESSSLSTAVAAKAATKS